ncbi:UNVERIFIED_CONTAM: hypothetical protein Sradi_3154800 [Sesamum radiatum]|uniref:Uncharacterized protein n=1 Tax=Sesamum radiatum TaxID=300843 RepID=A0AAW2RET7_SESRA
MPLRHAFLEFQLGAGARISLSELVDVFVPDLHLHREDSAHRPVVGKSGLPSYIRQLFDPVAGP